MGPLKITFGDMREMGVLVYCASLQWETPPDTPVAFIQVSDRHRRRHHHHRRRLRRRH